MRGDDPIFIHDTRRIVSANAAACALFRAEPLALVDLDILELLPDESDRRWMANMRLGQMRAGKFPPPFVHVFRRHDGTLFYGAVITDALGGGLFETTVLYLAEKRSRE